MKAVKFNYAIDANSNDFQLLIWEITKDGNKATIETHPTEPCYLITVDGPTAQEWEGFGNRDDLASRSAEVATGI